MDKIITFQEKRYKVLRTIRGHNIPEKQLALDWKQYLGADVVLKSGSVYLFGELCIEPEIIEEINE